MVSLPARTIKVNQPSSLHHSSVTMTKPTAHPLWTRILSAGYDAASAAAASIAYARQFAAIAITQRSHDAAAEEREIIQFEEVVSDHKRHDECDDDSVSSDRCVPTSALQSVESFLIRVRTVSCFFAYGAVVDGSPADPRQLFADGSNFDFGIMGSVRRCRDASLPAPTVALS